MFLVTVLNNLLDVLTRVKLVFLNSYLFFFQIFLGNNDPDEEALTVFDPPLFGRYLRIHPLGWINDIALRVEVLGCNTQEET